MKSHIQKDIRQTQALLEALCEEPSLEKLDDIMMECVSALHRKNKILFAGNGGSAADAQHLAAELVGRMTYHRPGLAAIALTTDTSALTAIGNDYGFDCVFSRQIEAIGQPGDVLIVLSTSGKSPNILKAVEAAKKRQIMTAVLCGREALRGKDAPPVVAHARMSVIIPSTDTQKIQEAHIVLGHILCNLIERTMYGGEYHELC